MTTMCPRCWTQIYRSYDFPFWSLVLSNLFVCLFVILLFFFFFWNRDVYSSSLLIIAVSNAKMSLLIVRGS